LNGLPEPMAVEREHAYRPRWWLHVLLLAATFVTTSVMGAEFAFDYRFNRPIDFVNALNGYAELLHHPTLLLFGLPFSLTLMIILLAHELGHYLTCRFHRIEATPPFFIPFPVPIGTFGAFIRITAPIYTRSALFDIAIAGPLAGFVLLVPALAVGIAYSKIIPGIANQGEIVFGVPLIVHLLEAAIFPGVPSADIYLNPVARAAWVGVLATALNLLPIGQLDGGHIVYSFFGEWTRKLSRALVLCLVVLGFFPKFNPTWLIWAAFLFFFGLRHPAIFDLAPMDSGRKRLGWIALIIFILCFTVEPIRR
jgi:membrane-associated protease RseP (regulator of RpoE activity)